jgi:hypothetical protein
MGREVYPPDGVGARDDPWGVVPALRELHRRMLLGLRLQLGRCTVEEAASVAAVQGGDVIYRIDQKGEEILVRFCEEWAREASFVLIAEGLSASGEQVFPEGADPEKAAFRLIVDPIDGTRGLMYSKRSAWILSGAAPNRGPETGLRDIQWAVMTEVPTVRARLADQLWAVRGCGACGVTYDLAGAELAEAGPACLAPSRAPDLRHGFATISKFFPGGKELTARLEEALFDRLLGTPADGTPQVFDDEYIASGGQLYELMAGHDRFIADLRPLILPKACPGEETGRLCAHPYDLCVELIAREAGVIVTGPSGEALDAPLSVHHNIAWIGYANETLRRQIEPVLQRLLREFGLV